MNNLFYIKQSAIISLNLSTLLCQDVCNMIMTTRHLLLVKVFKMIEDYPLLIQFYLSNNKILYMDAREPKDRKIIHYFCKQNKLLAMTDQCPTMVISERRCYNCNIWSQKKKINDVCRSNTVIICHLCDEKLGCTSWNCCENDELYKEDIRTKCYNRGSMTIKK